MKPLVGVTLAVCLLAATPLALAQEREEDPFAEDEDPIEGEDPFAEYEQQVDNTSQATQELAAEEDTGQDDGGDGDRSNASSDTGDEQTNDAPGFAASATVAVAGALAVLAGRRQS
jgi:hypothetical protein